MSYQGFCHWHIVSESRICLYLWRVTGITMNYSKSDVKMYASESNQTLQELQIAFWTKRKPPSPVCSVWLHIVRRTSSLTMIYLPWGNTGLWKQVQVFRKTSALAIKRWWSCSVALISTASVISVPKTIIKVISKSQPQQKGLNGSGICWTPLPGGGEERERRFSSRLIQEYQQNEELRWMRVWEQWQVLGFRLFQK